jgi:hypothetical protein
MNAELQTRPLPKTLVSGMLAWTVMRQIVRPQPQLRCPGCDSILYTRRHPLCGVCGEELPREILFTAEEAARVGSMMEVERQKHRAWMSRAQAR